MPKLTHILFAVVVGLMLVNPTLAMAQSAKIDVPEYTGVQESLTQYLCTPSETSDGRDL